MARDDLAAELDGNGLVSEPVAVLVSDDGTLVRNHRCDDSRRLERTAHRFHHPPGDDDHRHADRMGAPHRCDRPRTERDVGSHERAVEVRGHDTDAAGKVVGKPERRAQPFRLPWLAVTTYALTSAVC